MMSDDKNMDKAFREKLEGFNAEPPAHLWNGVQGKMNALHRKKRMAFYQWASVAALILLAFLAGWYFNSDTTVQTANELVESEIAPINETIPEKEEDVSSKQIESSDILTDQSRDQIADASHTVTLLQSDENIQKEAVADFPGEQTEGKEEISAIDLKLLISIDADLTNSTVEATSIQPKEKTDNYFGLTDEERKLIAANASNNRENKFKESGWKMGVNVSPGYSSYSSSHTESYAQGMAYSASEGGGNVGAGFSVQYKTGKKWSIESGVYYAQSGQKSRNSYELFARNNSADYGNFDSEVAFVPPKSLGAGEMAMNSTAGVIALDKLPQGTEIVASPESEINFSNAFLSRGEFSQVFDFIEIPMYLRYNIIDSKIGVDLLGGVNAGFIVGNNAYLDNEYGIQNIGKTEDISSLNMSGTVGLGVNYALGKHLSLAVEPRLNYYLNSINRNPAVDFRPYRIGFYTGLYYDF